MPNIAVILKAEIARVARKEVRLATESLQRASIEQRKQIASLKREISHLTKAIKVGQRAKSEVASGGDSDSGPSDAGLRWRAEGFAQHRKRLGLSAAQMARLVGCSSLSIYKWESGKVRPRAAQLQAIARVRGLSKSQALSELSAAES
jgi:DNA-binding XRE family transcriptional regulator